ELAVLREVDAVARIADDLGAPHDEALALVAADARAGVVENLRVVDPQPRTVEAFERCVAGAGDAHVLEIGGGASCEVDRFVRGVVPDAGVAAGEDGHALGRGDREAGVGSVRRSVEQDRAAAAPGDAGVDRLLQRAERGRGAAPDRLGDPRLRGAALGDRVGRFAAVARFSVARAGRAALANRARALARIVARAHAEHRVGVHAFAGGDVTSAVGALRVLGAAFAAIGVAAELPARAIGVLAAAHAQAPVLGTHRRALGARVVLRRARGARSLNAVRGVRRAIGGDVFAAL